MIELKLFVHKTGEDLSKYILQGARFKEDITQELDSGEITLLGYDRATPFEPETGFVLKTVQDEAETERHYICERDIVENPEIADAEYFTHHLYLIEPSAVAQKRPCDNISATYKLKDVNLEEQSSLPDDNILKRLNANITKYFNFEDVFSHSEKYSAPSYYTTKLKFGKYFVSNELVIRLNDGETLTKVYTKLETPTGTATIALPLIGIYGTLPPDSEHTTSYETTETQYIGNASYDYEIYEYDLGNDYNGTLVTSGSIIENRPLLSYTNNIRYAVANKPLVASNEWLLEENEILKNTATSTYYPKIYHRRYCDTSATTPYRNIEITVNVDKHYKIFTKLHNFKNPSTYPSGVTNYYTKSTPTYLINSKIDSYNSTNGNCAKSSTASQLYMDTSDLFKTVEFGFYSKNSEVKMLQSSTPYSALELLEKAILNSGMYQKKSGTDSIDVNANNTPFEIDGEFTSELATTKIIENFYNEKNLWEILLEIGNYIHAVPEIKLTDNDKYFITFNRLGATDKGDDNATRQTIFNSKGIEDYVSSCSSYITNMVQLGGHIEEWVAPKTNSEDYTISNDTAIIQVSKPIIELVDIKVRCEKTFGNIQAGSVADMTSFVFEKYVYQLLGINKNVLPNRGVAMYYELGDTKILGGQYQLPQANVTAYSDYAFKKIIYSAFNGYDANIPLGESPWANLKVSDFSFFVKYRTQDSVRQNQTRPDLRKYILNSKYDIVPQHWQFNNQTDIVIDSVSFGNNIYGKLIKTGNNNYTITEWVDNVDKLKKKGELYDINGDRYYVAKTTNTYYCSHIESQVEYSKDYNQLSPIIGIPSEPRFYEISERSTIRREVAVNDYLLVSTEQQLNGVEQNPRYLFKFEHISKLMFGGLTDFARYILLTFKGDKDANYSRTFYKDILLPLNANSSQNTLTYSCDMVDNFSAGDKIVNTDKANYESTRAVQYTDSYGKASLLDFYIIEKIENVSSANIKALPDSFIQSIYSTENDCVANYTVLASNRYDKLTDSEQDNDSGLILLKDCREAISFNYNLQLLTGSDQFVVSPFQFLPYKKNIKFALLDKEVNKLSNGYIDKGNILALYDLNISKIMLAETEIGFNLEIVNKDTISDDILAKTKAIAVVCDVSLDTTSTETSTASGDKSQFVLARNLPNNLARAEKLDNWAFRVPPTNFFRENG